MPPQQNERRAGPFQRFSIRPRVSILQCTLFSPRQTRLHIQHQTLSTSLRALAKNSCAEAKVSTLNPADRIRLPIARALRHHRPQHIPEPLSYSWCHLPLEKEFSCLHEEENSPLALH